MGLAINVGNFPMPRSETAPIGNTRAQFKTEEVKTSEI